MRPPGNLPDEKLFKSVVTLDMFNLMSHRLDKNQRSMLIFDLLF